MDHHQTNQYIHYRGPRRKGERKGGRKLFQRMDENFPTLREETDIQIHKAQQVPNKMNSKRPIRRHIIIKLLDIKDKERLLKAAREKQVVMQGNPLKTISRFFSKPKTIKLLEENIGGKLLGISLGDDFLGLTPKVKGNKSKKQSRGEHKKLKSFCTAQDTINKMKKQPTKGENTGKSCI